ncbi:MAG: hypothetical protein AAF514_22985, partial [Verrucomicrobiota bacterium]
MSESDSISRKLPASLAFFVFLFPIAPLSKSEEKADGASIRTHQLESPFQAKDTSLRILLPNQLKDGHRYPVLFVLPVHEDGLFKNGDGLAEVQELNLHNRQKLIC